MDFMETTHQSDAQKLQKILHTELNDTNKRLATQQARVAKLQGESRQFLLPDGTAVVHPIVQQVMTLGEKLSEVREGRLELQATLAAVQQAVHNRNLASGIRMPQE